MSNNRRNVRTPTKFDKNTKTIQIFGKTSIVLKNMSIQERIDEVTQLLKQLKMIRDEETNTQKALIMEHEEVVYNYESSEEGFPVEPKTEEKDIPSTSGQKRTYEFMKDDFWNSGEFDKYAEKRGFIKKDGGGYSKIPKEYKPIHQDENSSILNLDCIDNAPALFVSWTSKHGLELQLNKHFENFSDNEIWNYTQYYTRGSVQKFLSEQDYQTDVAPNLALVQGGPYAKFKYIVQTIYGEFIGKDIRDHSQDLINQEAEKARFHLANMIICDLCYFDNYTCEYRKYFYMLTPDERSTYIELFLQKLPAPFGRKMMEGFRKETAENKIANTLGGAIDIVRRTIDEECIQRSYRRTIGGAVKICCKGNPEIPQRYGCYDITKRKKTSKKKWKKRSYKPDLWKKKKRFFKRRDFSKKKKENPGKKKFCPTGKKSCKCWICHEEGHYANECPKKTKEKHKDKVKLLMEAEEEGFEPLESEASDIEEIFEIVEEDSESSSEEDEEQR
ncbi:putative capsid protein [Cestrum yellow leaf curling virus]|uniref:Capsid protein n=1 Tax=Cestrum yellow leaf curling virus TaxID=175814 RepID=CAPSD_CYLCV|nr:putative capsid protein [Cestrum yellow leaf curling virus]Q7TD09.1 RecName: Full=Capsid protein; Short=CP; AltName: Full=coat protein [Cestrum yellow leaf curling virus]AAP78923.1 putative capsid protein [Cestrum yellow leaf curling virus]